MGTRVTYCAVNLARRRNIYSSSLARFVGGIVSVSQVFESCYQSPRRMTQIVFARRARHLHTVRKMLTKVKKALTDSIILDDTTRFRNNSIVLHGAPLRGFVRFIDCKSLHLVSGDRNTFEMSGDCSIVQSGESHTDRRGTFCPPF